MYNTFHYLSMAIQSMIHKNIFLGLKDGGLTMGQPKVLEYLYYHDKATNKDIAAAGYIEPASLTSILGRMEKQGLVERRIPEANRRTICISLTPSGKRMAEKVIVEFQRIENVAFAGISEEEKEQFIGTYQKIHGNLERSRT